MKSIVRRRPGRGAPSANLSYYRVADKGGHFAAWEYPELFAGELRAAFASVKEGVR